MKDKPIVRYGREPGPTSVIFVGIHGNETCGPEALADILPNIEINNGRVIFAYGNLEAMARNAREYQANLNRMFKPDNELTAEERASYEYARAQELKPLMEEADVLLDIHASFNQDTKPFIICEPNGYEIASALPFNFAVSGFDDVEPGGTDYYMNKIGKIGICAECGYLGQAEAVEKAKATILAFLAARGHTRTSTTTTNQLKTLTLTDIYITKSDFQLVKTFPYFEPVREGQLIGYDGTLEVYAPRDGYILFTRTNLPRNEEAFLTVADNA